MQAIHICLLFTLAFIAVAILFCERSRQERERKARQRLKRYQVKFYYKDTAIDEYIEPELRVYYDTFIRAHSVDELKQQFRLSLGKDAVITKITKISENGDACEW